MQKILFIEDETKFQQSFLEFFKEGEFEVISAYDGVSGLKLAEENLPDLIVLDLISPKKDGFQVLVELKKNPRLAKIPFVVLTNLEGSEDISRAASLGAVSYLVKANYSLPEVAKEVRKYLVPRV